MVETIKLEVYEKTTPTIEFTLTDETSGAAVDLLGYNVYFAACLDPKTSGTSYLFNHICGTQLNGVCTATLGTSDTLTPGHYTADLEMVKGTFRDVVLEIDFYVKEKVIQ